MQIKIKVAVFISKIFFHVSLKYLLKITVWNIRAAYNYFHHY
jgi:hypothetical protein